MPHVAIGPSERNSNVREGPTWHRRSALDHGRRLHLQQFLDPFHLCGFEANSSLSSGASLKELDIDATSMNDQKLAPTQTEPCVERRPTYTQMTGCFGWSE